MATMVEGGSDLFDALAYATPSQTAYEYLAHRAHQASASLSQAGQMFMQTVKGYYDAMTGSEAANLMRQASKKMNDMWNADVVRYMQDIHSLQHANLRMQRWIMAEPTVRAMYHQNQCEGYADIYVDTDPGRIGDQHYDYRRVMDGIVVFQDNGEWYAKTYIDDLKPGDNPLLIDEKVDILATWDSVKYHLAQKLADPTSRYNSPL